MSARRLACGDARALLAERPDRPLDDREASALRAHLADCPPCAATAAGLERVEAILGAMETEDPGAAFSEAVVRRLDRAPGAPGWPRRLPAPPGRERILLGAFFAAGTAVVAALGVALLPGSPGVEAIRRSLPDLPPAARAGIAGWTEALPSLAGLPLPEWLAPAGAAAACLALGLQLASARRRPGA